MAAPGFFVFVVTDQALANAILDVITGRDAATLAALQSQTASLAKQVEGISTAPPAQPGA